MQSKCLKDVKEILDKVGEETSRHLGEVEDGKTEEIKQQLKSKGVVVTDLSPEEVRKVKEIVAPIIEEWIASMQKEGLNARPVVEQYLQLIKEAAKKFGK